MSMQKVDALELPWKRLWFLEKKHFYSCCWTMGQLLTTRQWRRLRFSVEIWKDWYAMFGSRSPYRYAIRRPPPEESPLAVRGSVDEQYDAPFSAVCSKSASSRQYQRTLYAWKGGSSRARDLSIEERQHKARGERFEETHMRLDFYSSKPLLQCHLTSFVFREPGRASSYISMVGRTSLTFYLWR